MVCFVSKDARDDRDLEFLSQNDFDSLSCQRLKQCVEKHNPITKIKN